MNQYIKNPRFMPTRALVETGVEKSELADRLMRRFPDLTFERVNDANEVILQATAEPAEKWQKTLLLARQRGPFLRLCPGTQKHICCLYHNLDVATGCDLGCSYCILQGYLNNPLITVYCNLADMYTELDEKLLRYPQQFYRIGTGELSDSLTFDHFLDIGADLVRYFADKPNAIIELKTKNVNVDGILGLQHNKRTVVSWSMNAESITQTEESLAPTIDDRLLAAREVQKAGYRIGFHFDPMIEHENWQDGYRETVNKIFRVIKPENIVWISLGALRYPPALDQVIRENNPQSRIVLGELLPGRDRKIRYFRPLREEMFGSMCKWIKNYSDAVFVYLCMESKQVWENAFGWSPKNSNELKKMLDERVKP